MAHQFWDWLNGHFRHLAHKVSDKRIKKLFEVLSIWKAQRSRMRIKGSKGVNAQHSCRACVWELIMVTGFPEECLLSNAGGKYFAPSISCFLFLIKATLSKGVKGCNSMTTYVLKTCESQWDNVRASGHWTAPPKCQCRMEPDASGRGAVHILHRMTFHITSVLCMMLYKWQLLSQHDGRWITKAFWFVSNSERSHPCLVTSTSYVSCHFAHL